ncbi:hypothetical protein ANANG_G00192830 [Anguilla anguilla]|uniref:PH domain-containing protein n=1 Tax=Anguilla anguilla TaxID=7936 RepID=A0A9D3M1G1_ANGAN|nr:hypothetical protein ANANG_G00192830 [Anguilla anguilla]
MSKGVSCASEQHSTVSAAQPSWSFSLILKATVFLGIYVVALSFPSPKYKNHTLILHTLSWDAHKRTRSNHPRTILFMFCLFSFYWTPHLHLFYPRVNWEKAKGLSVSVLGFEVCRVAMGDVISTHLDEGKREMITARTGEVMGDFGRLYEQQYALALVNSLRFEFEGNEGPQPQLLHRKVPLKDKSIFSGALFQYLEENKKWRNRFFFVPDTYKIQYFENKMAYERGLQPKATINCAGYRVLTSMDQYVELLSNSLPGVNAKASSSPFLKCATKFPLILWHPYARHFYFCVTSEKEQEKWHAVFQDCVRHTNDGLSEECKVQTPAFTDAVRLYRQGHGQYGTWDMMCGVPPQILANLVMETLLPS